MAHTKGSWGPWYVGAVTIYLLIAGLWTWCGVWWALLIDRMPLMWASGAALFALAQALCSFGAAYGVYRKSIGTLLLLLAILALQCHAFAQLYPTEMSLQDRGFDLDYLRGLPRQLQLSIGSYIGVGLYLLVLRRSRRF
jgi:hypothetical protein